MFLRLTDKQIDEHFMIVPYSFLCESLQVLANEVFAYVDLQNAYVLYITTDEKPIFIGYFILDKNHVTTSPLFESYRQNMIVAGEEDPLATMQNEQCLHLCSWVLDKQLDNTRLIKFIVHIASIIATENDNRPNILWCECGDELLCYRIEPKMLKQIVHILRYISIKMAMI